jgi:hypothetical protein
MTLDCTDGLMTHWRRACWLAIMGVPTLCD